ELERALDVLARGRPVALAPVAAGAPLEDVGDEAVVGAAGAAQQLERLREEADGGRDRGELVAAAAEVEEHACPVEIGEGAALGQVAGPGEPLERRFQLAALGHGPG